MKNIQLQTFSLRDILVTIRSINYAVIFDNNQCNTSIPLLREHYCYVLLYNKGVVFRNSCDFVFYNQFNSWWFATKRFEVWNSKLLVKFDNSTNNHTCKWLSRLVLYKCFRNGITQKIRNFITIYTNILFYNYISDFSASIWFWSDLFLFWNVLYYALFFSLVLTKQHSPL